MPKDPEMRKAALPGGPDRKVIISTVDNATFTADQQGLADRQARRLVRLFSLTAEVAATVAALAYPAGCQR